MLLAIAISVIALTYRKNRLQSLKLLHVCYPLLYSKNNSITFLRSILAMRRVVGTMFQRSRGRKWSGRLVAIWGCLPLGAPSTPSISLAKLIKEVRLTGVSSASQCSVQAGVSTNAFLKWPVMYERIRGTEK